MNLFHMDHYLIASSVKTTLSSPMLCMLVIQFVEFAQQMFYFFSKLIQNSLKRKMEIHPWCRRLLLWHGFKDYRFYWMQPEVTDIGFLLIKMHIYYKPPLYTVLLMCVMFYKWFVGLAYLHDNCDPPIIHMDVKSSNILITKDWEGKMSDFGISKPNSSDGGIPMPTKLAGTLGYMDPEYVLQS